MSLLAPLAVVGPAHAAAVAVAVDAAVRSGGRACDRADNAAGDCAADTAGYSRAACRANQRAGRRTLFSRVPARSAQARERQRRSQHQCANRFHLSLVGSLVIPRSKQRGKQRLVHL